ncbi:MAG: hypothetical protein HOU81_10715 [Hamadaea sp.]|uniref:DUF6220 domain-containing protein n=1 Tax=Hamadaea sp. TaxID=2024425 RepID=UPI0017EE35F2|nr:DUF6220 domain-containing protein [Hamadaea sp.]NUR71281.1 hypothetical protein [Hamadaea sp.]NUT23155.1 hypothetical protein [Hamadaea sp.]
MRKALLVTSGVLLAVFALQFAFAAVGAFTKPAGDSAYSLHRINGSVVIPLLILLMTLFAALAKAPGKLIGMAILPLGLVVLQPILAGIANGLTDDGGATSTVGLIVGALHAINAIIMVHFVVGVMRGAQKLGQPVQA